MGSPTPWVPPTAPFTYRTPPPNICSLAHCDPPTSPLSSQMGPPQTTTPSPPGAPPAHSTPPAALCPPSTMDSGTPGWLCGPPGSPSPPPSPPHVRAEVPLQHGAQSRAEAVQPPVEDVAARADQAAPKGAELWRMGGEGGRVRPGDPPTPTPPTPQRGSPNPTHRLRPWWAGSVVAVGAVGIISSPLLLAVLAGAPTAPLLGQGEGEEPPVPFLGVAVGGEPSPVQEMGGKRQERGGTDVGGGGRGGGQRVLTWGAGSGRGGAWGGRAMRREGRRGAAAARGGRAAQCRGGPSWGGSSPSGPRGGSWPSARPPARRSPWHGPAPRAAGAPSGSAGRGGVTARGPTPGVPSRLGDPPTPATRGAKPHCHAAPGAPQDGRAALPCR